MSKKKLQKKHAFRHTSTTSTSTRVDDHSHATPSAEAIKAPVKQASALASSPAGLGDFTYVGRDLRKIAILAIGFVAGEFILWYLMNYTSLGAMVYGILKV